MTVKAELDPVATEAYRIPEVVLGKDLTYLTAAEDGRITEVAIPSILRVDNAHETDHVRSLLRVLGNDDLVISHHKRGSDVVTGIERLHRQDINAAGIKVFLPGPLGEIERGTVTWEKKTIKSSIRDLAIRAKNKFFFSF